MDKIRKYTNTALLLSMMKAAFQAGYAAAVIAYLEKLKNNPVAMPMPFNFNAKTESEEAWQQSDAKEIIEEKLKRL